MHNILICPCMIVAYRVRLDHLSAIFSLILQELFISHH
jgi:hypothetical protein